ncbi:hypothetical protein BDV25DRAFT_142187 [Aspergillus avenaceus]|uniref:Uncharacterized protein n=1 Tax=Aspergillus avenaceus TaxID=36643 RepID=A0A5N6TPF2_ASPAV|nr:hypothetical protein BDV25DRAFT_142187 [Aspergillus avenaceus]
MATNTRFKKEPSQDILEPYLDFNPMKDFLDEGKLNLKSRDRKFTTFLDLKMDHHSDFIHRLREHVQHYGYEWSELLASENERYACAESFVEQHGFNYWGSEASRKKYLLEEAIKDPACLTTYPERRDEIVRTVVILLERKAKTHTRTPEKKSIESYDELQMVNSRRSSGFGSALSDDDTETMNNTPSKGLHTLAHFPQSESRPKREVSERSITVPPDMGNVSFEPRSKRTRTSAPEIRPFSRVLEYDEKEDSAKTYKPASQKATKAATRKNVVPEAAGKQVGATGGKYPDDTKFLVVASSQMGMAPVWVSFQNFPSASAFLEHMANECRVYEWDPATQLFTESSHLQAMQGNLAASVKFEWSGFEIRVRQGKDHDWAVVMEELQKAWKAKELNVDGGSVPCFKIRVMLHVR